MIKDAENGATEVESQCRSNPCDIALGTTSEDNRDDENGAEISDEKSSPASVVGDNEEKHQTPDASKGSGTEIGGQTGDSTPSCRPNPAPSRWMPPGSDRGSAAFNFSSRAAG